MKLLSTFFNAIVLWMVLGSICAGQEASSLYPFTDDPPQPGYRARSFELFALGQYWSADAFTLDDARTRFFSGPVIRTKAGFPHAVQGVPGFGFAYNINNHFAVRSEFAFGDRDYLVGNPSMDVFRREVAFVHEGKFNLDYNILSSRFTPFVSAGVGYWYLGAAETTSFPEWHFALNAVAGLRWDITDHLFLKAYGGGSWANVDHPDWASTFQATLAAGWRF